MNVIHKTLSISLLALLFTSCIKDEPANQEADILSFEIPEWNITYDDIFFTSLTGEKLNISLFIPEAILENARSTPKITISPGATISPAADSEQDFKNPVTYTVTSENRQTIREYTFTTTYRLQLEYSFENWETNTAPNKHYETPYEIVDDKKQTIWGSGNSGVAIYMDGEINDYPTHKTTAMTADGTYAAELLTKQGPGSILGIQYIPIVAGSLFTGTLNPLNALANPLLATQFGTTYTINELPDRFTGYYYYRPGDGPYIYVDPNDRMSSLADPNKKDMCSIYAVLYEADSTYQFTLNGTNIMTDPSVVSIATLPDDLRKSSPGTGLYSFDVPFTLKVDESKIDFKNKYYKIAVVFSSSYDGDKYAGVPGSKLIVDKVKITTKEQESE